MFQRGFDFFGLELFEFPGKAGSNVGQRLGEEAGVVEIVDQRRDQGAVACAERADDELVEQVLAQAGASDGPLRVIAVFVRAAGAAVIVPVGVVEARICGESKMMVNATFALTKTQPCGIDPRNWQAQAAC